MSDLIRDAAATSVVFGFFASSWFGWAQERPPRRWRPGLVAGAVVSLLVTAFGAYQLWENWNTATALDRTTSILFGVVVATQVIMIGVGSLVLSRRGRAELISALVALVVGVHFIPLAFLLDDPMLYGVAAALMAAAPVSVIVARRQSVAISAITGVAAGSILLLGAAIALANVLVS